MLDSAKGASLVIVGHGTSWRLQGWPFCVGCALANLGGCNNGHPVACARAHAHTHTYTHTHARTHTHTHTHTNPGGCKNGYAVKAALLAPKEPHLGTF
eukprot:1160385-Pelagomonas_calceolata.AAC.7